MANYSKEPQTVNVDTWFYDGKRGITVVHEARTKAGEYIQTDQFLIPWSKLEAALKRHKTTPAKKAKRK